MRETEAEAMVIADNTYRTRDYIVVQNIGVKYDSEEDNVVFSHDTYYRRTKERDAEYEKIFSSRVNIDGRRLPSTMYARTYVE